MDRIILKGHGKTVIADDSNITIKYSWYNGRGIGKEKVIPFSQIISVMIKKPGLLGGYILFQTIGGVNNSIYKDAQDIYKDENGITFNSNEKYKIALKIKELIENSKNTHTMSSNISVADEIKKLKKLLEENIISEEEYEKQKNKLMN